jgi:hypothetical protein
MIGKINHNGSKKGNDGETHFHLKQLNPKMALEFQAHFCINTNAYASFVAPGSSLYPFEYKIKNKSIKTCHGAPNPVLYQFQHKCMRKCI